MTNSKNQCTGCKKYFLVEVMKIVQAGKFCTQKCLKNWASKSTDKLLAKVRQIDKERDYFEKGK